MGIMEKKMETIRVILGLYRDNGKENGNYYLGFRIQGSLFRVKVSGFRVQGSWYEFRPECSGFSLGGKDFKGQGLGVAVFMVPPSPPRYYTPKRALN